MNYKMKRINLLLLMLVTVIFTSNAQLLWKISGKGLKEPSYIFGTHHLIPIQFLDSVPGLFPAFNSSKTIVSEVALNNIDATSKIQKSALLPDSVSLKNLLSSIDYDFVNKEITNLLRIDINSINKMHPSLITTLYELELYKQNMHFDENTKSDSYFQIVAFQKNIPVVGLETVDKQIELLFPKNIKKEAQTLIKSILKKDDLIVQMKVMNEFYRAGDLNGLAKLSQQSNKQFNVTEEENAALLDNRNLEWVKQIPALMKKNSCFIAVGALHLPGEKGLINLLRKEGYQVKPVIIK